MVDKKPTNSIKVTNLPPDVITKDVRKYFKQAGQVKSIFFKPEEGVAYVHYTNPEDATVAAVNLNNAVFFGNNIKVVYATSKAKDKVDLKVNARKILVKNIAKDATSDGIRHLFEKYGCIEELNIVRSAFYGRPGQMAFIQFQNKASIASAKKELHLHKYKGQILHVEKLKSKSVSKEKKPELEENKDRGEETGTELEEHLYRERSGSKKHENQSPAEENLKTAKVKRKKKKSKGGENLKAEEGKRKKGVADEGDMESSKKKKKTSPPEMGDAVAADVIVPCQRGGFSGRRKTLREDGRSLFIQNIIPTVTKPDLEERFKVFGKIVYVTLCYHSDTGLFKGTAFVRYQEKEAADRCLAASVDTLRETEFKFLGQKVRVAVALDKEDLEKERKERLGRADGPKGTRNLHLAKEGVIVPNTSAAEGVSKGDMNLRASCEFLKQQMLRNYDIFVSPTRLIIRNLPLNMDSQGLRKLLIAHCPKDATVTECRVMVDKLQLDDNERPTSKGFGFVSFTEHAHALVALRMLNNNPSVFSVFRRPYVEFSLENRRALEARERRMLKSREKNPNFRKKGNKAEKMPELTSHSTGGGGQPFMGLMFDSRFKKRHRDMKKSGKISRGTISSKFRKARRTFKKQKSIEQKEFYKKHKSS